MRLLRDRVTEIRETGAMFALVERLGVIVQWLVDLRVGFAQASLMQRNQ